MAKKHVAISHPGAASFDELHALDYLVYAYLQGAEDQKARQILVRVAALNKVDAPVVAAAYAFTAIPARYALERGRWSEAARLELHPASFPWDHFRYAEALIYYARAVGAARSGNTASARKDVEKLSALQSALNEPSGSYWPNQVEVERRTANAWLALAEGNKAEALTLMRSAADLEATTEKHPVTPGPISWRSLLGDMLIEHQPGQALRV